MLNKKVLLGLGLIGGAILLKDNCDKQLEYEKYRVINKIDDVSYADLWAFFNHLDNAGEYNLKKLISNNIRELKDCVSEARSINEVHKIYQKYENYISYVKTSYSHLV